MCVSARTLEGLVLEVCVCVCVLERERVPQGRWKASSSRSSLKSSWGRAVLKMRVELNGAASVVHSLKYCDVTISCSKVSSSTVVKLVQVLPRTTTTCSSTTR